MIIFSIWCGVLDSVIMADSLMPEAQQSIIVSYYQLILLLKVVVEL